MLTYGSLFSGVGGFDMGFDKAGYDCKWQVEWDSYCQQTLQYHWPDVPKYLDVRHVHGRVITPVDVVIYGSPCQDLSVAGKRAGLDGDKSSMFFESVRIFKEMRDATNGTFPRVVIWENVPGALSSNRGEDFKAVLTALDDIGALAQWWTVLDAQFFGVPQRRRRVFLISVFDSGTANQPQNHEIFAVGEGRRRSAQKGRQTGEGASSHVARSIGFSHTQGLDPQPSEIATPTLRSNGSGMAVATNFDEYNFTGGQDIHHQIRAGTRQSTGVLQDTVVRRLTPIECERLMGWPDDHTLHRIDGKTHTDSTRYKMCGNGVATPVAQWVAEQVKEHLFNRAAAPSI